MLARPAVHVGALGAIALALCVGRAATAPLDGDPAMYATIAKTIVATGEWLRLTFNGEPYLNKPPLHFWVNALVFHVLPPTTFTAVLAPGLLGVADTLLVYALARAMFPGWETAFFAALVYVTTPEVVHWSGGVHLETLVTFWVLVGLLAAYRSVAAPPAVLWLGAASAGGWLAKGPQGLYPLAVAGVLWAREGLLGRRLGSPWALAGAAVALAAVGPWLWVRIAEGTGFGRAYFGGQIAQVLLERGELDRGPLWYVGKLLRTYWPWLPVAAAGLALLARRWRESLGARLWLVYAAVVMLVISLAAGKKSRYLFQLYPALATAAGVALAAASAHVRRLPALALAAATTAAALVAAAGEQVPAAQAARTRDVLEVAAALPDGPAVWITERVQRGEPQVGKILGFYARPLLRTCRGACAGEAAPGALVVTRAEEADAAAAALAADTVRRNATLALLRVPARGAIFVDSQKSGS
jgi:4-amino-4-deoxy-L-arabinose transferase-like glycosyltransferase